MSGTPLGTLAGVPETTIAPSTNPWLKPLWFVLGLAALIVGVVGIFLPLIPTTGPLLIAAFAFARSSPRFHTWLMNHPRLGTFIRDFQAGRGIPLSTKIVAVAAMATAFTYATVGIFDHLAIRLVIAAVGIWAIWYVVHLPTTRRD